MPLDDDAARRTARERSQARMGRFGDPYPRASSNSYGRARQEADHLSQSRYARQAPRQASQVSRELESPSQRRRASESQRGAKGSRAPRDPRGDARQGSRSSRSSGRTSSDTKQQRASKAPQSGSSGLGGLGGLTGLLGKLPSFAVPAGIAAIAIVILLVLVFAVLVPSCQQSEGGGQAPSASSQPATTQSIVRTTGKAVAAKRSEVETANQVGSLQTSNASVEALVSLLGEEEAAKLIAQAKTNPDALWIAAHLDEFAFDGIEVQYKILKLAADEPASIPYVRGFPTKYPMNEAVTDKDLAMGVASPSENVPTTNIPHLYQWDRRWAYTIYSSTSFGMTGCGPTSLAMVYQGLNRTVDKTPYDIAAIAEERGFMSEFNGTDSMFFLEVAEELGLNCWEAYPDAANIVDELSNGNAIIVNLGPGFFTANGHFFVLAGLDKDGKVIVNDPYSVVRSSQTWDADFIAAESIAMFVYAKA